MKRFQNAADYFAHHKDWEQELLFLREILIASDLAETIKWGAPVYTLSGKNVVGVGAFKSYVGLWFFQGVFLKDPYGLLVNAQENKTKAMRQMRFQSLNEMDASRIRSFVEEAIQNQKEGKEIKADRTKPVIIPPELEAEFAKNKELLECFNNLSKTKKREYADYISEAKRVDTKQKRLAKILPLIEAGVGLNDKYK